MLTAASRGIGLSERSEDSAWNSCMPPVRSQGRMAIAITTMPTPPSQFSSARQSRMLCGISSRPISTVEPVVVTPDMASKKASV